MFDTLIKRGRIVTQDGLMEADIGIRGGRIAAILSPGLAPGAASVVDATGLIALPGLVDAHVHFRDPGLTHKEDFTSGTAAAAAGGVTTALVMPTDDPPSFTADDLAAKRRIAEGRLHVDVGLQAAAVSPAHIAEVAAAGAMSVELFLGDVPDWLKVPDAGTLASILAEAAKAGLVAGITPADGSIIAAALPAAREQGRIGFFRSRPVLSEAIATAAAIAAAADTGAAIHLRQISCRDSLAFVADALLRGLDVTAETTPHYLLLDEHEIERQGPFAKVLPPLRPAVHQDALWAALVPGGAIAMVATDHAPHSENEKRRGEVDIWAAPGGFPGVQTMLPLLLDAVHAGRINWCDLVRLCAEAPARRFGLFPRKGSLRPGADADIVLVDPARREQIQADQQFSKAKATPFAGRQVTGWPVLTLLRGTVVMRDGHVSEQPGGSVIGPQRPIARLRP
jgi:dihydroorotase